MSLRVTAGRINTNEQQEVSGKKTIKRRPSENQPLPEDNKHLRLELIYWGADRSKVNKISSEALEKIRESKAWVRLEVENARDIDKIVAHLMDPNKKKKRKRAEI